MKSVREKVLEYIRKRGRGIFVFPSDFAGFGRSGTIKEVLGKLAKEKILFRPGYGIYYFPKNDPVLGLLYPSLDEIAHAVARRDEVVITPTTDSAMNLLGLSEQVPINVVYLTNGRSKEIKIGKNKITFKQASNRRTAAGKRYMGLIVRALEGVGQQRITAQELEDIHQKMAEVSDMEILSAAKKAPQWIANIFSDFVKKRYGKLADSGPQKTS